MSAPPQPQQALVLPVAVPAPTGPAALPVHEEALEARPDGLDTVSITLSNLWALLDTWFPANHVFVGTLGCDQGRARVVHAVYVTSTHPRDTPGTTGTPGQPGRPEADLEQVRALFDEAIAAEEAALHDPGHLD